MSRPKAKLNFYFIYLILSPHKNQNVIFEH